MATFNKRIRAGVASLGIVLFAMSVHSARSEQDQSPSYEIDPTWPKPLPNHWVVGAVRGIAVDKDNNVWMHQNPPDLPAGGDAKPAPPVLEFDPQGNLIKSWGGPGQGHDWPVADHSIFVDKAGNVWISGNGPLDLAHPKGDGDRMVLEFTNDGKLIREIGHPAPLPPNSADTSLLGLVAGIDIDEKAHEVYFADGYANRRVIVFDSQTGSFKRMWGAYGHVPDDTDLGPYKATDPPAQQFRGPVHCVSLSNDGLVYVCDRGNKRVQVFSKEGKFVKEFMVPEASVRAEMQGAGSASALVFSRDKGQKYVFAADGESNVIWILRRDDGSVVGKFGGKGTDPGQFTRVHSLAEDTKGNLYTGELAPGSRIQRFVLARGN